MCVALVIEIAVGVLIFAAAIFDYFILRFRPLSGVVFLWGCHTTAVIGLMWWYLFTGRGLEMIFITSEAAFVFCAPVSLLTMVGQGKRGNYTQTTFIGVWFQMVARFCFQWRR